MEGFVTNKYRLIRQFPLLQRKAYFLLLGLTLWAFDGIAQLPVKYDYFSKPPIGNLSVVLPATPQSSQFKPITVQTSIQPATSTIGIPPINFNDHVRQRNDALREEVEATRPKADVMAELERETQDERGYAEQIEWARKTRSYQSAFNALMNLNPDSFSISKAVYLVENAFFDGKLKFDRFMGQLAFRADLVKQILKREKLSSKDNMALNYGIQKLYQQNNSFYDSKNKRTLVVKPFKYDFDDFRGEKEYFKMFASKMMTTNSGQCHSMPLLYLMIAEQVGAKAWLSLAPQHSFIQFPDKNGNLLNFESTNGNLVSSNWLLQSGFINANALKTKTYLDTLSQRKLFAQCLADLLLGYTSKFGYDAYAEHIRQTIQAIHPANMTAELFDANIKTQIALQEINAVGHPKEVDLPNFPNAYRAYLDMHAAYQQIDEMGYQEMPKEAYQAWLKTIDQEKKKQESLRLKEEMQKEIQFLKKRKSVVVDRTKD